MRKLIGVLVLLLGVLFLLARAAELQELLKVVQRGNLIFIALALLIQIGWLYNFSAFYQSVYRALGQVERRFDLFKLVMAANFLTVVAPSAGLSAIAIFVADARRKGQSSARATVVCFLYVWFEYIGVLTALGIGMAVMAGRGILQWPELTAGAILLACAILLSLTLYLGLRSAPALGRLLARLARAGNTLLYPFVHRPLWNIEDAFGFARELAEGIGMLRGHPRWLIRPLLLALLNKGLLWLVLLCCFLAFGVPFDAGTIVAGLGIAHLFLIISPTPAGVGVVEGILPFSFNRLGIPLGDATIVTLVYRGFSFWLPFFIGMIAFRLLDPGKKPHAQPMVLEPVSTSTLQE